MEMVVFRKEKSAHKRSSLNFSHLDDDLESVAEAFLYNDVNEYLIMSNYSFASEYKFIYFFVRRKLTGAELYKEGSRSISVEKKIKIN